MALYLGGSTKLKINIGDEVFYFNTYTSSSTNNNTVLMSSDNFKLKDSMGVFLTVKEDE